MAISLLSLAGSLAGAGILYFTVALIRHRRMFRDLPKPPYSFFWGHLRLLGSITTRLPADIHPFIAFTHLKHVYRLPEIWYLDLWPLGPVFMMVTSPDAAAEISQTKSFAKHEVNEEFLAPLVGRDTIPAINGGLWKKIHHLLAPAFKPSNIKILLSSVADETLVFNRKLEALANADQPTNLEEVISKLIFEIVAKALIGTQFNAQTSGSEIYEDIRYPAANTAAENATWNPAKKLMMKWRREAALRKSSAWLRAKFLERYDELKGMEKKQVPGCILDSCLTDKIEDEEKGAPGLREDEAWMNLVVNNMRALVFGGHGTTTDTLVFAYLMLSINPATLQKLREEHDRVAGPRIQDALTLLRTAPHRTSELEYTNSVIKETLRYFPIGMSVRKDDKTGGTLVYKGKSYPTNNKYIAIVPHTIHHDPAVYQDPTAFKPERFMDPGTVPRNAWRPFELGPRACMGRELAMDEMRAVLLLTVRWFDFALADVRPCKEARLAWTDLDTKIGDWAFQELALEAKPRSGMMWKIQRTDKAF